MAEIVAINLKERVGLTDGGDLCPITNMIDSDGEDAASADDAVAVIVMVSAQVWMVVLVQDYERRQVH